MARAPRAWGGVAGYREAMRALSLVCCALLGGSIALGCGSSTSDRSERRVEPRAARGPSGEPTEPTEAAEPSEPSEPSAVQPAREQARAAPQVTVGACDVGWLPEGTVVDVSPEETESLAEAMRQWLDEGAVRELLVDTRRGIVFAKSEDDLGADPPYPTRTQAQSTLACGVSAGWLTDSIRSDFARAASPDFGGVTCQDNVCCYPGMEYASRGILVARRETVADTPRWILDAYLQVAEAALGEEHVTRNREHVARALERERRLRCRGEPVGYQ